ncbi:UTP--glucose-1-phosphate uridylyltransferase GalU [Hyphobacterium sp.]|uniref:UTP--glucose-1-phosphate uridylyltransferase GalU n=1 Tax=Hyphobacterium sp. TaxID=2004662 RepID=UPI0037495B42
MKTVRKAVLPVAGLGTRVLPATKSVPKEMLPVFDRPAIQYVVNEAFEAGIEHIVFVTGRNKSSIDDHFDRAYELESSLREKNKSDILDQLEGERPIAGSMSFVRQQSPLGLGHAVWCARDVIGDEPFAVLLPDVLVKAKPSCLTQMIAAYNDRGGNIIAVEPVPHDQVNMYGIIEPKSRDGAIIEMAGMVEKPSIDDAPSNLSITGRYILQPEIFNLLSNQARGSGGEIQLTDAMATLMETQDFFALEYQGESFDCGSKQGYLRAFLRYALDHQLEGEASHATLRRLLDENAASSV